MRRPAVRGARLLLNSPPDPRRRVLATHLLSATHVLPRRVSTTVTMGAASFINDVNTKYEALHRDFEEQFWGTKMALSDEKFSVAELTRTKGEMEASLRQIPQQHTHTHTATHTQPHTYSRLPAGIPGRRGEA